MRIRIQKPIPELSQNSETEAAENSDSRCGIIFIILIHQRDCEMACGVFFPSVVNLSVPVQQKIKKTKRRAPKAENGPKHLLTDYLYCADCHSKLWHHTNTRNKEIHFFSCSNYSGDYGGTCTSRHYIRADAIEQVVLLELRRLASFLRYDEEAFADILAQKTNRDMLAEQKRLEGELQKAIARNETVVRMYEKLYEDNASGKVTDEWFMQLSHKYEVERMELKNKISDYRQRLSELGSMQQGRDSFLQAIRRFMEMGTLTAPLLQELIDHIDVYETEGKGKHRTQRVVIYYRFVGYIDLSEADFEDALLQQENHRAETRQGVAVEYLPEKPKPEHRPEDAIA